MVGQFHGEYGTSNIIFSSVVQYRVQYELNFNETFISYLRKKLEWFFKYVVNFILISLVPIHWHIKMKPSAGFFEYLNTLILRFPFIIRSSDDRHQLRTTCKLTIAPSIAEHMNQVSLGVNSSFLRNYLVKICVSLAF